jgi:predicted nucleotidyltransferase
MGHDQRDRLKDYWSTLEQFFMAFYGNTMKRDIFLNFLRFLYFSDKNEPDKTAENYDRLWKMRTIFDKLNDAYAKYYSPTEHLEIDEIIVLFKERVVFKQNIPKKHKRFGIKIYKLCDSKGYTYIQHVRVFRKR